MSWEQMPPWPSRCVCSRDSIQQTRSPGLGGWELLSSNWKRSKGCSHMGESSLSGDTAALTQPAGSVLAVSARKCLVPEYLVPLLYFPPTALMSAAWGPPGQTVVSSPTVLHKANQYSHLPGSFMHCIPAKKKAFSSPCCSKYSQHLVILCWCPTYSACAGRAVPPVRSAGGVQEAQGISLWRCSVCLFPLALLGNSPPV